MPDHNQISSPVAKAASALTVGAGTSYAATVTAQASSFLPTDLSGWLACGASGAALIYSLCLLTEWWWKRALRDVCVRLGLVAPKAKHG